MTAVAERPAPPAPGQTAAGQPARRRIDAVTVLSVYTLLLIAIPAALVVAPLGAVGGPATIFAALVLVFYLVTWLHPAVAPARGRQAVRAAAILLTCAVIATYVSANRHAMPGLEENGIDRGIILICGWLGVLVMASDGIPSMERLKKLLGRVVIGATAMAMLGITQFFTGLDATQYIVIPGLRPQTLATDLLSRNGLNRPSATAAHPLEFAAVLGMVLPIAINRARFAPPGKRLQRWLQVALIGAAMPMTVSRSAVLAIIAVCLVLLPTWPKLERRIAYIVLGLGVTSLWFLVPGLVGTFRGLFATLGGDTSTTSRTSAYGNAAPYISQHPWFGHGFNTFFPATYFFTDDQYLLSLIEIGVVGLLALLALFITGLVTAQRIRRATTDPEMRDLGQSLTATIAVSMVAFGTFDALSFNMAAGLTFMLLGCTGAALRLVRQQGAQPGRQLAGRAVVQTDQEPPAITHRPDPGTPGALGALSGTRLRQPNGHRTAPAERQPAEPPEQADEHRPAPAEKRPEQGAEPRHEERVEAQVEELADRYLGERADGHLEQQADGHLAEPPEARREEPAGAHAKPPAEPAGEDYPWPREPQEQAAEPRQEKQPTEARAEEPAEAKADQPKAQVDQAEAQVDQPKAQVDQPKAQVDQPKAEVEQPAKALWDARRKAEPGDQPMADAAPAQQAEDPASQPAAEPAAAQEEQSGDQPAATAPGQPADAVPDQPADAAPAQQAEDPASEPTAEPASGRPEELTIPIPIIRD
jgi:O-antigen ligase